MKNDFSCSLGDAFTCSPVTEELFYILYDVLLSETVKNWQ